MATHAPPQAVCTVCGTAPQAYGRSVCADCMRYGMRSSVDPCGCDGDAVCRTHRLPIVVAIHRKRQSRLRRMANPT